MPMTVESNAAQERIWDAAQSFKATHMNGIWTMMLVAEPTSERDSVLIRVEHEDYNQALVELKVRLDAADA